MKRNWDMIRSLMIQLEEQEPGEGLQSTTNDKAEAEHMALLVESGLCYGEVLRSESGYPHVILAGLTWEGYDLLDGIRSEIAWSSIKSILKKLGGGIAFDVLKKVAAKIAMEAVGLQS